MNDQEKRIKLAEFVGWKRLEHDPDRWYHDDRPQEECRRTENLPDPKNNANADYAILERMRNHERWTEFSRVLADYCNRTCDYQIGDYGKVALKVIENEAQAA